MKHIYFLGLILTVALTTSSKGLSATLAVGQKHTCSIDYDSIANTDTLYCWGANQYGQLGTAEVSDLCTTDDQLQPCAMSPKAIKNFPHDSTTSIAAGNWHTCILRAGSVWCWGRNNLGQLGMNYVDQASTRKPNIIAIPGSAVPADPDQKITHLSAYSSTNCAANSLFQVYCWGEAWFKTNFPNGAIKRTIKPGTFGFTATPTLIQNLPKMPIHSLTVGDRRACVIYANGELWCWGLGENTTIIGRGDTSETVYRSIQKDTVEIIVSPIQVPVPGETLLPSEEGVLQIRAAKGVRFPKSNTHVRSVWPSARIQLAIIGKKLLAWIADRELEKNLLLEQPFELQTENCSPMELKTPNFLLSQNGDLFFYENTIEINRPIQIKKIKIPDSPAVSEAASGSNHTCLKTTRNAVFCFGKNSSGELGNGTTINSMEPTDVVFYE